MKADTSGEMSRRQFVVEVGSVVILLPASGWLSCGGSSTPGGGGGDQTALTFTSSTDSGHNHTYQILMSELSNPPTAGINRETSLASGHTHVVAITQAELQSIQNGQTVTKTSTVASGHSHTFQFRK